MTANEQKLEAAQNLRPTDHNAMDMDYKTLNGTNTWPYCVAGVLILLAMIGGFGFWAYSAQLKGAVISEAKFEVESRRKTVQHLHGGIIAEILVGEGDQVKAGDTLLRLDRTTDEANLAVVQTELDQLKAQYARLDAELLDKPLTFEASSAGKSPSAVSSRITQGQRQLHETRKHARESERRVRAKRVVKLQQEIAGIERQKASNQRQIAIVSEELEGLRALEKRQLVPKPRLLSLEREAERIRGQSAALDVGIVRAKNSIDEITLEGARIEREFKEQVSSQMREIEPRIAQLKQQYISAAVRLSLVEVRAPTDGYVVDMRVSTVGGVVKPGDDLLDIVPADESLVLSARVLPLDVDKIRNGQQARVQLSAFDLTSIPEARAEVLSVSADRLTDDRTGDSYFLARLKLSDQQPKAIATLQLVPGMPATVFIDTGERTPLSYLLQPFTDRLKRAFVDG